MSFLMGYEYADTLVIFSGMTMAFYNQNDSQKPSKSSQNDSNSREIGWGFLELILKWMRFLILVFKWLIGLFS